MTRDLDFGRLVRPWPKLPALARSGTAVDWAAAERQMAADFRAHLMRGASVPAGSDPAAVFEERKGRVAEVFQGVRRHYGAGRDRIIYAPRADLGAVQHRERGDGGDDF